MKADLSYLVRSRDRVLTVLAAARSYSAAQRRREPLSHLTDLAGRLSEGPLTFEGGGVSWRVSTPDGFADWVELVYEAGAPLGLSARLFDRPRIGLETLPSRLTSRACTATLDGADLAQGDIAFSELTEALEVQDINDPEVLASIYRIFKIWAPS